MRASRSVAVFTELAMSEIYRLFGQRKSKYATFFGQDQPCLLGIFGRAGAAVPEQS